MVRFFKTLAHYLVYRVLIFVAGFAAAALLSFVFTGNLTGTAYSERIFWVSVAVFLVGGMMAFAHLVPGRMLMFPFNIRRPEDARKFVDSTTEYRESAEKRMDVGIQIWLIGLGCLAISAAVQTWLA